MSRKLSVFPWLKKRSNGIWYVHWYDPKTRRTHKRSCKTGNQAIAEANHFRHLPPKIPRRPTSLVFGSSDPWRSMAVVMCKRARENAKQKGREYSLRPETVLEMLKAQNFKCAVTGLDLRLPEAKRDPWAPSLDQIRPGKGYHAHNVRVVSMLVNTAMNQWGEGPILELVNKMSKRAKFAPDSSNVRGLDKLDEPAFLQ